MAGCEDLRPTVVTVRCCAACSPSSRRSTCPRPAQSVHRRRPTAGLEYAPRPRSSRRASSLCGAHRFKRMLTAQATSTVVTSVVTPRACLSGLKTSASPRRMDLKSAASSLGRASSTPSLAVTTSFATSASVNVSSSPPPATILAPSTSSSAGSVAASLPPSAIASASSTPHAPLAAGLVVAGLIVLAALVVGRVVWRRRRRDRLAASPGPDDVSPIRLVAKGDDDVDEKAFWGSADASAHSAPLDMETCV